MPKNPKDSFVFLVAKKGKQIQVTKGEGHFENVLNSLLEATRRAKDINTLTRAVLNIFVNKTKG